MKLQMSSIKFDADVTLLDLIQKKADKLETYYDKIIDGEVNLIVNKNDKRDNKVCEIKLNVPGTTLFAKEQKESFEAAADEAMESLRRQLRKFKGKEADRVKTN